MKSPLILTSAFVATGITVIGYLISEYASLGEPTSVAVALFIGAILSPMVIKLMSGSESASGEVKTLHFLGTIIVKICLFV